MNNVIPFPPRPAAPAVVPQEPIALVVDESMPARVACDVPVLHLAKGLASVGLRVKCDPLTGELHIMRAVQS
jgi:hypothetical protein